MKRSCRPYTILIALALTFATPLSTTAGGSGRDITSTSRGQELTTESAARFGAQGVPTSASDLSVIELPDGGVITLPSRLADRITISSQIVDGMLRYTATVDVGDALAEGGQSTVGGGPFQTAAAPYPQVRESGCFDTMYLRTAHFDVCYEITQVMNDGIGTTDYWGLEQWGTAFESLNGLRSAYVSGQRRSGSNAQSWLRWSPTSNLTKNCVGIFIGVTYFVTIGSTFEVCEKWTITKSPNGTSPSFKTEWGCNAPLCGLGTDNRDVAYTIMTTLAQGQTPLYTLGYGMDHW